MKRILFICTVLFVCILASAQDFSYLKAIDVEDEEQSTEAAEAAMECCCYLTGVRYNKKDSQRQNASSFVRKWLEANHSDNYLINGLIEKDTEVGDIYMAYFALNYLNHDQQGGLRELQLDALKNVVEYCANTANKIKMTKELKEVEKHMQAGQLDDFIANLRLTTQVE
ncbi:hypothetical protein KEM09_12715 [Carboxylicivirga mesophila]|uniref:Secreted protein n=1 Tax=Carboxylicivirga mesophila TaxID=1166478 RepID=A0ABS5KB74_9BACT|nr:hypothetical protein [Carboxylicivirga mesophila]MBS2212270.1 hypothetical protein [Carboxylicivirga mesophila]